MADRMYRVKESKGNRFHTIQEVIKSGEYCIPLFDSESKSIREKLGVEMSEDSISQDILVRYNGKFYNIRFVFPIGDKDIIYVTERKVIDVTD